MTSEQNGGGRVPSSSPAHLETSTEDYTALSAQRNTASSPGLRIRSDDQELTASALDFGDAEFCDHLSERLRTAESIEIHDVELLYAFNQDSRERFIHLISNPSLPEIQYTVSGGAELQSSLLQALLSDTRPISPNDYDRVQSVVATLLASAAVLGSHSIPQAALDIQKYLVRQGIEAPTVNDLKKRITRAQNDRDDDGDQKKLTPQGAADVVLRSMQEKRQARDEDISTAPPIWFWKEKYHVWNGKRWKPEGSIQLPSTRILQKVVKNQQHLTTSYIQSVETNIQAKTELDIADGPLPVRLSGGNSPTAEPAQILSFRDGMLDLSVLGSVESTLQVDPHDPTVFGAPFIDIDYDPNAECPVFMQTLAEIFPNEGPDDHRIDLIQEAMGYALLPWNHSQEITFILHGHGANGKSLLLEILQGLLGRENVSHISLDGLQDKFRIGESIGKLANIASDMPFIPKVQEGLLKQLVSGERLQVNEKYQKPTTRIPTAKMFFATNKLPKFSDTSDGIWRRLKIIPFNRQFREAERDLTRARRIIASELPGVLNFALDGARRLLIRSCLSSCSVCQSALDRHRKDSDTLRSFVTDRCEVRDDFEVPTAEFFGAYRAYCLENGSKPKALSTIGAELPSLLPTVSRDRGSTGDRKYFYSGLRLATSSSTVSQGVPAHPAPTPPRGRS